MLQINMAYWADIFSQDPGHDTAGLNHAAYRHFVLGGMAGLAQMSAESSQAVCRIRDRFPSTNGLYTGFQLSRLA